MTLAAVLADWNATTGARYGVTLKAKTRPEQPPHDYRAVVEADLPTLTVRGQAIADALALYPPAFIQGSQLESILLCGLPTTGTIGSAGATEIVLGADPSDAAGVTGLFHHELTHALMAATVPGYRDQWWTGDRPTEAWTRHNPSAYGPYIGDDAPGFASNYAGSSFWEDTAETAKHLWAGTLAPRLPGDPALMAKARLLVGWYSRHGLTRFDALVGLPPKVAPVPVAPPVVVPAPVPVPPPPAATPEAAVKRGPFLYAYQNPHAALRANGLRFHGYPTRATPPRLIGVHTSESALDVIGVDSGAEAVARFQSTTDRPSSYHRLVDSDSTVMCLPDEAVAFGIGNLNGPTLHLSFALKAAQWSHTGPNTIARRELALERGAVVVAEWCAAYGIPARRITLAQAKAGQRGLIAHGDADPGRRSDPGPAFPWDRFLARVNALLTPPPPPLQEDDMTELVTADGIKMYLSHPFFGARHIPTSEEFWALAEVGHIKAGTEAKKISAVRLAALVAVATRAAA